MTKAKREWPGLAAALAVLNLRGSVLLVQRHPDSAVGGGTWSFPGGKVELGESMERAAIRECEEEIGLKVEVAGYSRIVTEDMYWGDEHHFVTHYYEAAQYTGEPTIMEPHKISDWKWCTFEGVRELAHTESSFEPLREFVRLGGLEHLAGVDRLLRSLHASAEQAGAE